MPRVTVIMATYNWSTVLPYSIGSVLDQTFTDWELLVVGDGCTDDSGRVVAAVGDARVRWIDLRPGTHHQYGPNPLDALMVNLPTHPYDYADPDHWRLPFDSPEIPYTWQVRESPVRLRADAARRP